MFKNALYAYQRILSYVTLCELLNICMHTKHYNSYVYFVCGHVMIKALASNHNNNVLWCYCHEKGIQLSLILYTKNYHSFTLTTNNTCKQDRLLFCATATKIKQIITNLYIHKHSLYNEIIIYLSIYHVYDTIFNIT